jgi:glucan phosphoethanolaminetransferase (alkaline phosphatase superfamily)
MTKGALDLTGLGWISFLILLILDLVLRRFYTSISEVTPTALGIALCFSIFLWSFIDLIIRCCPAKLQRILINIVSLFWVILLGSQATAFMRFGEYSTPFMVNWVMQDPRYVLDYLWPFLNIYFFSAFIVVWWTFNRLWSYGRLNLSRSKLRRQVPWLKITISLFLSLVAINQLRRETLGQLKLADGALAFSVDSAVRGSEIGGYHFSRRTQLKSSISNKLLPHIFLFIGESWSKSMVPSYGWTQSNTMPFLTNLVKAESIITYNSAHTNSGATDVSIPSLFSGVGPEESADKLHRVPLIWDWARAAGYRTLFISPQRLAFNGVHQFFLSPGPDYFIPGDAIDYQMVNDSGIDDLLAVNFLNRKLTSIDLKNEPLLIIFFHNALHFPFLTQSPGVSVPDFKTRYEKALFITDRVLKDIVELLKKHEMWDKTLFWMTADHGEVEFSKHKVPRISSFYQEIIGIPFFIRWPTSPALRTVIEKCKTKSTLISELNVQNIDIVPTLIDLWGLGEINKAKSLFLRGKSLCEDIDPQRVLIHLNTNKMRRWSPEGFAVTMGSRRFAFTNIEGNKFFDLSDVHSAGQEREIPIGNNPIIEPFIKVINSENLLKEIWSRYGN